MASAVVAAAPHSVPPLPLSRIPRVRPPRFLPGQPRDDQLPQPEGSVPSSHVWTQGKWRNRASNAVSDRRKVVSQQVKKAIEKRYHGLNIYAYYHLLTKQVVYSLTRHMQVSFYTISVRASTNAREVRPGHAPACLPRQENCPCHPST